MPEFLLSLIGIGTAAGGGTTAASVLGALGTLGGIAGAGTSIGETIANGGGQKTPMQTPTPPPNAQQLLQERGLVGQQDSNLQSSLSGTGGSDFLSLFAPYLAGLSGQPGANAAGQFGVNQNWTPANSQPTNAAVQGQPVSLSDFINSNT